MIDLDKIEKRLDEALAKETKESLMSWLDSQRKPSFPDFLFFKEFKFAEFQNQAYTASFQQKSPLGDAFKASEHLWQENYFSNIIDSARLDFNLEQILMSEQDVNISLENELTLETDYLNDMSSNDIPETSYNKAA